MRLYNLFESATADGWLEKYTLENLNKWPSSQVVSDLLKSYANDEEMVIYRGMNFTTKELYDEFIDDIQDGQITIGSISSWSQDKGTSEQFALTKPSYYPDLETMKEYEKASREGEELSGYRGVILKTTIPPNTGIDVSKSDYAKESEVILPKGTYKVEIEQVKKYKEMMDDFDIDDVVKNFYSDENDENLMTRFASYLVKHKPEKLREETITNFIKKYGKFSINGSNIIVRDKKDSYFNDDDYHDSSIRIFYNNWPYFFMEKGLVSDKMENALKAKAKSLMKQLSDIAKKHPKAKIECYGLSKVANLCGLENEFTEILRGTIGKQYNDATGKKAIDDINAIEDPKEKRRAIDKYAKNIEDILNGFNRL